MDATAKILTEPAATRSKRRKPKLRRGLWLAAGVVLMLVGAVELRRPLFLGNHDVVDAGRVFRSAQPQANWDRLIESDHLASVLNLRGGSASDPFYAAEVQVLNDRGVSFYDLSMSATRRPGRRELLALLDLFERCEYPLLIHCKSGADRTGLASVLYLMSQRNLAPDQALQAFSIAYGHVPLGGPERLHEPLDEYRNWLARKGLAHTPALFRGWVTSEYQSDDPPGEFTPIAKGPRVRHRRDAVAVPPISPSISR